MLKAKMILDTFFIREQVEGKFELPNMGSISKDDSFNLSQEEKKSRLDAINTFVNYYNSISGSKCKTSEEVLINFSVFLDENEYNKIEPLMNIIYDILFYEDFDNLELKVNIRKKLKKIYKVNDLNFSFSKQIDNILDVYLYKEHYTTKILTKYRRYKEKLEELALVDPLTGFFNRRALEDYILPNIINDSERYGSNFSLIGIDLDNFKQINDNLGHIVGDEILKDFASIIKQTLRGSAYVIRNGGDEFLIIAKLDEKEIEGLLVLSERIRKKIEEGLNKRSFENKDYITKDLLIEQLEDNFKDADKDLSHISTEMTIKSLLYEFENLKSVTASIGVKILSNKFKELCTTKEKLIDCFNREELVKLDKLVYKSKKGGRNRVSIYEGEN